MIDDNSTDWLDDDMEGSRNKFLVNYARFNITAKMTVIVKKFNIPLPEELKRSKKRKSRFRRLIKRGRKSCS